MLQWLMVPTLHQDKVTTDVMQDTISDIPSTGYHQYKRTQSVICTKFLLSAYVFVRSLNVSFV